MTGVPDREKNQERFQAERQRYMRGELDHDEYYCWLADWIGVGTELLPVPLDRIRASTDPHYNDIQLTRWDRKDSDVRPLAYKLGLPWALSDTVCVLKAVARRAVSTP